MKTTDLIPLILLELNNGDKYGFELTKDIETKSNNQIVIKQPTLYTILKKLEKSKFIRSYWLDSDIGGKRHYYAITQNGKLQVSTLPSFDQLIANILASDVEDEELEADSSIQSQQSAKDEPQAQATIQPIAPRPKVIEQDGLSIMDAIFEANQPTETILPSTEVFDNDNIDTATELEINKSNTELLKPIAEVADATFATNDKVTAFTKQIPVEPKPQFDNMVKVQTQQAKTESVHIVDYPFSDMRYVDYESFLSKKEYIYARSCANKRLIRMLTTSTYLLAVLILSYVMAYFSKPNALFYISTTIGICALIFYPCLVLVSNKKFRLRCSEIEYSPNHLKRIVIAISIIILSFVAFIITNAIISINIFTLSNMANIYPAILISLALAIDTLSGYLLFK